MNLHLDSTERIVLQVRKHWFILLRDLFAVALLFAAPFVLIAGLLYFASGNPLLGTIEKIPASVVSFAIFAWLLMFWMKAFAIFTDYYLDVWTITDRRIIAINQRGFFNRETSSLRMEKIQDLEIHVAGLIETLLDFGALKVETAGEDPEPFTINGIPRPKWVKEEILRIYDPKVDRQTREISGV